MSRRFDFPHSVFKRISDFQTMLNLMILCSCHDVRLEFECVGVVVLKSLHYCCLSLDFTEIQVIIFPFFISLYFTSFVTSAIIMLVAGLYCCTW